MLPDAFEVSALEAVGNDRFAVKAMHGRKSTQPFLIALAILLIEGTYGRSTDLQSVAGNNMEQKPGAAITLANDRTTASVPVAPEILNNPPAVLELSITRVVNPGKTPVAIVVYIAPDAEKGPEKPNRIQIGTVGLYPPDSTNKFLLRASTALRKLRPRGVIKDSGHVHLIIELIRLNKAKPWTPVELTVEPKWSFNDSK